MADPFTMAVIGSASGQASSLAGMVSSAISSRRAYKYAKKLQQHQYNLNQQSLRESPTNARLGYTQAGYNPLMALGSNMSGMTPSATMSPTDPDLAGAMNQGINSAMSALQTKSQIENTDAGTQLTKEQAETEKAKRIQMDFDNSYKDALTNRENKALSYDDRRHSAEILEMMERAKNYRATSAIGRMNAETERMNAETNKSNSAISAKRAKFQNFKDYHDAKYGNPLKTAGYSWDKNTSYYQGGLPDF